MKVKNLVFEGGGVWGYAYAGALDALQDFNLLEDVTSVAGTSAGSIVSLLVALGYDLKEIKEMVAHIDYPKFRDKRSRWRLLTKYGLYAGDYAYSLIKSFVKGKLGDENATFADLENARNKDNNNNFRELRVFATNLSTEQVEEFSYRNPKRQNTSIALAVRASMSIPLFFAAVFIDDEVFVDGGATLAYPILAYGLEELEHTIGFGFLKANATKQAVKPSRFGILNPITYVQRLFQTIMLSQSAVFDSNQGIRMRTVLIETGDISATDFSLNAQQRDQLYKWGLDAATNFLEIHNLKEVSGGFIDLTPVLA